MQQPTFPPGTEFIVEDDDLGGDARRVALRYPTYTSALDAMRGALGDPVLFARYRDYVTEIGTPEDAYRAARDCWSAHNAAHVAA